MIFIGLLTHSQKQKGEKKGVDWSTAYVVSSKAFFLIRFFARLAHKMGFHVWLCDGVADEVEINAAIDSFSNNRGKVILSGGTFNASAIKLPSDVSLIGQGADRTTLSVETLGPKSCGA